MPQRSADRPSPPPSSVDLGAAVTIWAAALLLALGLASLGRVVLAREIAREARLWRAAAPRLVRARVLDPHPSEVVVRWLPAAVGREVAAAGALPLLELTSGAWGVMAEPPPPEVGPIPSPGPPYP